MTQNPRTPTSHRAAIHSPPQTVDDAHDFLHTVWAQHPEVGSGDRMALETVLSELIANVIQHNPDRRVLCEVELTVAADHLLLQTWDTGNPLPDPSSERSMPGESAESGRGLPLIHLLADEVDYSHQDGRNVWLVRRARR